MLLPSEPEILGRRREIEYEITGDNLQLVQVELSPGEKVYAEAGSMAYMTGNLVMTAKERGGIWKDLKRKMAKETCFVTEFEAKGGKGVAAFGGDVPKKIVPLNLHDGNGSTWILQKDAFLAAESTVDMDIAFQKNSAASSLAGNYRLEDIKEK